VGKGGVKSRRNGPGVGVTQFAIAWPGQVLNPPGNFGGVTAMGCRLGPPEV